MTPSKALASSLGAIARVLLLIQVGACDDASTAGTGAATNVGGASTTTATPTSTSTTSSSTTGSGMSCVPANCDDGVACTTDVCRADGVCLHLIEASACSPSQYCDLTKGCTGAPICATDDDCKEAWKTDPCKSMPTCNHSTSLCSFVLLDSDDDKHAAMACGGDDCDDGKALLHPQATDFFRDFCDGLDEDCDGLVDEDWNNASLVFPERCDEFELCSGGSCVCEPGKDCGSYCADLASDPDNCGDCGGHCGLPRMCSASKCICSAPFTECSDGSCTMLDTEKHCGNCTNACPTPTTCSSGSCTACPGATPDVCNGKCVNKSNDEQNCGTCGHTCSASGFCIGGMCQSGPSATTGSMSTGAAPICGDFNVDPGEQCDDGNMMSGDGCSSNCMIE